MGKYKDIVSLFSYPSKPVRLGASAWCVVLFSIAAWVVLCDQAQAKPMLRMGVPADTPPLAFSGQERSYRGLAVDLAVLVAKSLRCELEIEVGSAAQLSSRLTEGRIDLICGLTLGQASRLEHRVLDSGARMQRSIFVHEGTHTITCARDFANHSIAIVRGDPYLYPTQAYQNTRFVEVDNNQQGLRLLESRYVEAFVTDSAEVVSFLAELMGMQGIRRVGIPLEETKITILVKGDNIQLVSKVSDALGHIRAEKLIGTLQDKWFGKDVASTTIWDRYQVYIKYISLIILAVIGAALCWNFLLRRQVNRVTKDLLLSRQQYQDLVEASPDMIFLVTPEGVFRLANRIARESLCLPPDFSRQQPCIFDRLDEEAGASLRSLFEQACAEGSSKLELTIALPGEQRPPLDFIAFSTPDPIGSGVLICCIARDMSERNKMQAELVSADKLATIGKIAAGVAHEINNPLGIVQVHAELLAGEGQLTEDKNRHLETILRNVQRASKITEDLLNLATPVSMHLESISLEHLIRESLAYLKPRLGEVETGLHFPDGPLQLVCDSERMQQVIINLLLNALESLEGKGRITVIGRAIEDEDQKTIRILIADTGRGIAKTELSNIFDIFYSTRGRKGFGLGLFICKRNVEQHGGLIYAESEAGKGTSFIIELPCNKAK